MGTENWVSVFILSFISWVTSSKVLNFFVAQLSHCKIEKTIVSNFRVFLWGLNEILGTQVSDYCLTQKSTHNNFSLLLKYSLFFKNI